MESKLCSKVMTSCHFKQYNNHFHRAVVKILAQKKGIFVEASNVETCDNKYSDGKTSVS